MVVTTGRASNSGPYVNSSLWAWNNKYLIPVMLQGPCAARGPLNRSGLPPPCSAPARDMSEGSNQWDLACATDAITRQVNKRFRAVRGVYLQGPVWKDVWQISSVSCCNLHDMWRACAVVHAQEHDKDKGKSRQKLRGVCVQPTLREWQGCWVHKQLHFPWYHLGPSSALLQTLIQGQQIWPELKKRKRKKTPVITPTTSCIFQ